MSVDRIRWRHSDCDPTACVATMEQGCEPTVLLAALAAPAPDLIAAVEALPGGICDLEGALHPDLVERRAVLALLRAAASREAGS